MLLFTYKGLLYILLCLLFFNIGCLLVNKNIYSNNKIVVINYCKIFRVFKILLAISIINTIILLYKNGLSLNNIINISAVASVANENAIERYSGDVSEGIFGRLIAMINYSNVIIGGYMFCLLPSKLRFLSISSIFPMILSGLLKGGKMGTITGCLLWIIGFMISCETFNYKVKINFKIILIIVCSILTFFAIMLLNMMMRIGHIDIETLGIVTEKMVSYALGHLPAFDIWFANVDVNFSDLTFGGKTFYGITNTLGILKRESGVFSEFSQVSTTGSTTNVYTIFRVFIEDFGIIGTPIFLLFMGFVTTSIYNLFLHKVNLTVTSSLYLMICFFIGWSFVMSVFAYATYIILPVFIWAILKWSGLRTIRNDNRFNNVQD